MAQYSATFHTRTIITGEDARSFYRDVGNAIKQLEDVGRECGSPYTEVVDEHLPLIGPRFRFPEVVELIKRGADPYKAMAGARHNKAADQVTLAERIDMKVRIMHAIYGGGCSDSVFPVDGDREVH